MKKTQSLKFDLENAFAKAKKISGRHIDGISINFPFVSLNVKPDDRETRIANEIVIRLADRRVLNARECCDNCIDEALESLQGIRKVIVDKQVELYDAKESALYLLFEMMAEGLRQFLTFEQQLNRPQRGALRSAHPDFWRPPEAREEYFAALEALRGHLNRCLREVARLGNVTLPKTGILTDYETPWPVEMYVRPRLPS